MLHFFEHLKLLSRELRTHGSSLAINVFQGPSQNLSLFSFPKFRLTAAGQESQDWQIMLDGDEELDESLLADSQNDVENPGNIKQESPNDAMCRICHSGEEDGKLYAPCGCKGSLAWAHEHCLSNWASQRMRDLDPQRSTLSNRRPSGTCATCELCGVPYNIPLHFVRLPGNFMHLVVYTYCKYTF